MRKNIRIIDLRVNNGRNSYVRTLMTKCILGDDNFFYKKNRTRSRDLRPNSKICPVKTN